MEGLFRFGAGSGLFSRACTLASDQTLLREGERDKADSEGEVIDTVAAAAVVVVVVVVDSASTPRTSNKQDAAFRTASRCAKESFFFFLWQG